MNSFLKVSLHLVLLVALTSGCTQFENRSQGGPLPGGGSRSSTLQFLGSCRLQMETEDRCTEWYLPQDAIDRNLQMGTTKMIMAQCDESYPENEFSETQRCSRTEALGICETDSTYNSVNSSFKQIWYSFSEGTEQLKSNCNILNRPPNVVSRWTDL